MLILIVDDEQPARRKISRFILECLSSAQVVEASNGIEAINTIQDLKPDMVFLDIQMPGMSGFDVIEAVGLDQIPPVVFVTAYDQYALNAFEMQAIDYLLKPFDVQRFKKAFDRALKHIRLEEKNRDDIKRLIAHITQKNPYPKRLMVKENGRLFFIKTDEIERISIEDKYLRIYKGRKSHLIRQTMRSIEKQLDPEKFIRIHRSHIVNIEFISELRPWFHGDYIVIMKDGVELNLSRRYSDRLLFIL